MVLIISVTEMSVLRTLKACNAEIMVVSEINPQTKGAQHRHRNIYNRLIM